MSTPPKQAINFADNFEPPFTDGTYSVAISQTITGIENGPGPLSSSPKIFTVKGVRFTLPNQDIYTVFPPPNITGHFSNCFPHIISTRTTLPWERALPSSPCWLALLVFTSDKAPQLVQGAIKDLLPTQPPPNLFYPVLSLDPWESENDSCQVIDIPSTVFQTLAPSLTDLQYLAHGRRITDVTDKATNNDQPSTGDFSVLVANRPAQILPEESIGEVTVHLVSLEGWADYLPESSKSIPASTVRLISLYNWSFQTANDETTFEEYLRKLNITPSSLYFSPPSPTSFVLNALRMGYLPFNHRTRLGDQTASWYRGPLVPYPVKAPLSSPEKFSSDAFVNFDPDTGLLDVSYAAAFQLGQLLALQNKSIAIAIYQWKRQLKQQTIRRALRTGFCAGDGLECFLKNSPLLTTIPPPDPLPKDVATWLCNLILLKGIPYHYLLPDQRLLPSESLRFFYLDYQWLQSLIYGVFSLGKHTPTDALLLKTFLPTVFKSLQSQVRHIRAKKLGIEAPPLTDTPTIITGFLLRSQVVSGWPGLEVSGYSDPVSDPPPPNLKTALKIKMERLSPTLLLCLFEGAVTAVKFQEPSEGVHFGVEEEGLQKGQLIKELKYPLKYGENAGLLINPPITVQAPVREGDPNVLKVTAFNQSLCQALKDAKYPAGNPDSTLLSPSDFALQMTQGVEYVIFSTPSTPTKGSLCHPH